MSLPPPGPGSWTREGLQGYATHVGPLWIDAQGQLALRVEPKHTNITGRVHGGMAMGLASMAFSHVAQRAAQAARPGCRATLLTHHCELIDSAQIGDWVFADAQVVRTTRTMVFVTGGLHSGERQLMTASAVFQIAPDAPTTRAREAKPLALPSGFAVREPVDLFSAHVAPIYERRDENDERFGGFHVGSDYLDANGNDEIDAGMMMMLADLFLGRRVRMGSGSICVTVGMGISRLAPAHLGDMLEFDSRVEGQNGENLVATGHFRVSGQPVMSVTSLWKMVEKK